MAIQPKKASQPPPLPFGGTGYFKKVITERGVPEWRMHIKSPKGGPELVCSVSKDASDAQRAELQKKLLAGKYDLAKTDTDIEYKLRTLSAKESVAQAEALTREFRRLHPEMEV